MVFVNETSTSLIRIYLIYSFTNTNQKSKKFRNNEKLKENSNTLFSLIFIKKNAFMKNRFPHTHTDIHIQVEIDAL